MMDYIDNELPDYTTYYPEKQHRPRRYDQHSPARHHWTTEESGSECDHLEQRQRFRRQQCHRMDSDYATDYLHQRRTASHYDRPCFDTQPMRRKHDRSTSNDRPSSRRGSRSGSGTPRRRRNQRTPTTPTRSRANLDKRFNSGSRTRPIIKPDKYDGKTDLETYLVKFESLASYNGWDQLDRAAHLKASLIDGAASLLWQVQDASYQEVVNKLRCRYGTHEQQEKFRLELRTRKRKPGEKVQELSQDIERCLLYTSPSPRDS